MASTNRSPSLPSSLHLSILQNFNLLLPKKKNPALPLHHLLPPKGRALTPTLPLKNLPPRTPIPASLLLPPPTTPTHSLQPQPQIEVSPISSIGKTVIPSKRGIEEPRKRTFVRVWSKEDEIVVLNCIAELTMKGSSLVKNMDVLYKTVKKAVHFEATRDQVINKIQSLKTKYKRKAKKGKALMNAHDKKVFHLSEKIWGENTENSVELSTGEKQKPEPKAKAAAEEATSTAKAATEEESQRRYPYLMDALNSLSKVLVRRVLAKISDLKAAELEDKCSKLHMMRLEAFEMHSVLIQEMLQLFRDALMPED